MWWHWFFFLSLSLFVTQTRTGVAPGTCGTWISDGTCPAEKRRPLLFIYWKWFSSQNLNGCRGLRRESRTWPGEKAQQRPVKINYILMQTGRRSVKGQNLECICERCWLYGCVLFPATTSCRAWLLFSTASSEPGGCCRHWKESPSPSCKLVLWNSWKWLKHCLVSMSWMNFKLSLHTSVHSMVNLDETTLYTGMEYGAEDTWTTSLLLTMDTTWDITKFTLSSQYRLYLQMNLERTTEMPSAVWWGSCCVSVVFDTKSGHHILPSGRSRTHQGHFCHFCLFTLQITFWSTRRTTQSLFSPLSRWAGTRIKERFEYIMKIEYIFWIM